MHTWPQRICRSGGMLGRKRAMKSATIAVDALERLAESVEMVAANTAAITSPAIHGGSSVAMNTGRMLSALGIATSSISGWHL